MVGALYFVLVATIFFPIHNVLAWNGVDGEWSGWLDLGGKRYSSEMIIKHGNDKAIGKMTISDGAREENRILLGSKIEKTKIHLAFGKNSDSIFPTFVFDLSFNGNKLTGSFITSSEEKGTALYEKRSASFSSEDKRAIRGLEYELYNREARMVIHKAFTAAQAYYTYHPTKVVNIDILSKEGFKISDGIVLNVIEGKQDNLLITSRHTKGNIEYTVSASGSITLEKIENFEKSNQLYAKRKNRLKRGDLAGKWHIGASGCMELDRKKTTTNIYQNGDNITFLLWGPKWSGYKEIKFQGTYRSGILRASAQNLYKDSDGPVYISFQIEATDTGSKLCGTLSYQGRQSGRPMGFNGTSTPTTTICFNPLFF